jgi:hypothetical protein
MNFTVTDVAGTKHSINLSTDTRYPVAMDGGPRGFLKRPRPARDQEPGELPESIDAATAAEMISQILARCDDPDSVLQQVQQGSERSDESGMDAGTEFPVRQGFVPSASGKTAPKLQMDAAQKARRDQAAADSAFEAYPHLRNILGR